MTPRENFLNFFRGASYERIPSSFDVCKFLPAMVPENVARGMVVQQDPMDESQYGGPGFFGIDWVYEPQAKGSISLKPIYDDLDELENWRQDVPFPDYDALDWEGCAAENAQFLAERQDLVIGTTIYTGFFERLISIVGFENAAIALVDEDYQDIIHGLFDALADSYIDFIRRMHRHFRVEWVELHDDWGTQRSPMMSAALHQEMIAPYVKKVAEACHALGVIYEQHSCGKIEPLIPNLIATGADTWRGQPINDKKALVDAYGHQFKFAATIQPGGPVSDEEALQMARDYKRDYAGKDVWVFLHPNLTPDQRALVMQEIYSN